MKLFDSVESAGTPNVTGTNLGVQESEGRADSFWGTILDVRDLAETFKCSREKIKRMARRGDLPAFKFGKHWYVRQEDLERFLANQVESGSHLRRDQENRE
jgi:excisionase family DNA binding protein